MSEPDRINVEAILDDLFASEINAEISWFWYGRLDGRLRRRGIDVKLGDPLNGYAAVGKARHDGGRRRVAQRPGLPAVPG